jgi:uncharacterized protein (DUF427 family)
MRVQAKWNGTVIAEADKDNTLTIENNYYFPSSAIKEEYFQESDMHTSCPWKGEANYYSITVNGQTNENAAWYYPQPKPGSSEVVSEQNDGKNDGDFKNYVAFGNGVEVSEVA